MFGYARDGSSWRESSCVSLLPPRAASHVWAYDFVFDACANGQQIKCLSVVAAAGDHPRRQASSGCITCSARVG